MGRLQLTGMPADVLALLLAACTVPALHRSAATNKLIHEAGAERRRKIAVLKLTPFCALGLTCADVKTAILYGKQLDDSTIIKLSEALASGAMAQLKVSWRPTALLACLETWHTRLPDPDVWFGVPYTGALA
jgi:hypothetical protein